MLQECMIMSKSDKGNGDGCNICPKCNRKFLTKYKYDRHMNNVNGCDPEKIHGNFGKKKDGATTPMKQLKYNDGNRIICECCKDKNGKSVSFSNEYNYKRHLNTEAHKAKINVERNFSISGNNNTTHFTDNSVNNYNIGDNIKLVINVTIPPELAKKPYTDANIDDLSLFQQYIIMATEDIPYISILDNLNYHPDKDEYHNIEYKNLKCNTVSVHEGDGLKSKFITEVLNNIIMTDRILLCKIFNKFRIFMGSECCKIQINHLYSGLPCYSKEYKMLSSQIKHHLYNKRGPKEYPPMGDDNIPDKENPVWQKLSKTFRWKEVTDYITRMTDLGIDFDQNLQKIYNAIIAHLNQTPSEQKPTERAFFAKIQERIKALVRQINTNTPTSDDDEGSLRIIGKESARTIRVRGSSLIKPSIQKKEKSTKPAENKKPRCKIITFESIRPEPSEEDKKGPEQTESSESDDHKNQSKTKRSGGHKKGSELSDESNRHKKKKSTGRKKKSRRSRHSGSKTANPKKSKSLEHK